MIFTGVVLMWPYDLIKFFEPDEVMNIWFTFTMFTGGFLFGWFIGWLNFIWEPEE